MRPGCGRRRRTLALSADPTGNRPLAAAILNPPPSARARPLRRRSQSASGDARRLAGRSGAGHAGIDKAAAARGGGGAVEVPAQIPSPRELPADGQGGRGRCADGPWCPWDATSLKGRSLPEPAVQGRAVTKPKYLCTSARTCAVPSSRLDSCRAWRPRLPAHRLSLYGSAQRPSC